MRIVVAGRSIGLLTGFFGVGGGFMIVPVLTLWMGFHFLRAVATSLVIITITGIAALAAHLSLGAQIDVPVTVALAGATGAGALAGTLDRRARSAGGAGPRVRDRRQPASRCFCSSTSCCSAGRRTAEAAA